MVKRSTNNDFANVIKQVKPTTKKTKLTKDLFKNFKLEKRLLPYDS